jgi:hypothetical protein
VTIQEGKDANIDVLDNDDPGSAPFDEDTLTIIGPPAHSDPGDYRVHNDHIHYRSVDDYSGPDSITYRICNFDGLCSTATIWITVTL